MIQERSKQNSAKFNPRSTKSERHFNLWNEMKKALNFKGKRKYYHEREIWWCYLGVNIGYEQDGKGTQSMRPVLIIKGYSDKVCLVVPLTTSLKSNPYHVSLGLVSGKSAAAITSQVRLVDTKRLINRIGYSDKASFEFTKKAIKDVL